MSISGPTKPDNGRMDVEHFLDLVNERADEDQRDAYIKRLESVKGVTIDAAREAFTLDAACWFLAVVDAMAMIESYSIKEWARAIQDGISGYHDEDDIEGWLVTQYDDEEDLYAVYDRIVVMLDQHFGPRE